MTQKLHCYMLWKMLRCHTPCTLWRSCHNTNTSTRRAMQSTTSRKSWWLGTTPYGFGFGWLTYGDFHVDVRWFQPWITEANGWSAFGFEPDTEIQGVGFPDVHGFPFFCWGFILGELWGLHQTCGSELATWRYCWTLVVGDGVTFQNMGLREFILVSLRMTCEKNDATTIEATYNR